MVFLVVDLQPILAVVVCRVGDDAVVVVEAWPGILDQYPWAMYAIVEAFILMSRSR